MTEEKIKRINELYNKAKTEGLSEEEKKEQQVPSHILLPHQQTPLF